MRTITALMGDGIGPEVMESAMRVVEATGVEVEWQRTYAGTTAVEKYGNPLPPGTIGSIETNKVVLKGPCNTPSREGFRSVNVRLRQQFDLYVNMRPITSFAGIKSRYENVDLIIFRENVEDFYAGMGHYVEGSENIAELTGRITYSNSVRFFIYVFDKAERLGRKKVTVAHKANIFKAYHDIFLRAGWQVAANYPNIKFEEVIVDALSMKLILDPTKFDVIAAPNVFGDILSDLCAGLVGGLGLAPGANIGPDCAIFEAVHGTAPDIAGHNKANPVALILSAAMMLDYLEERKAASMIRVAVRDVLAEGKYVTRDINPNGVGTIEMTSAIIDRINYLHDLRAECCA